MFLKNNHLKNYFGILIIVFAMLPLNSCKDDDDNHLYDSLSGSTWRITSSTDFDFQVGDVFRFNSDGTLNVDQWDIQDYTWSVHNGNLKLVEDPDEYTLGTFTVSENHTATYTYYWYFDGKRYGDSQVIQFVKN